MRVLLLVLLLVSTSAMAESYKVWRYTENVHVLLTENACVKPKVGLQVRAVKDDGKKIHGCYVPEGKNMIRITWDNKDFAVLELKNFEPVSEAMYNLIYIN